MPLGTRKDEAELRTYLVGFMGDTKVRTFNLMEHRVRCQYGRLTAARMALPISFPLKRLAVASCDLGRTDMGPDTKQEVRQLGDDFIERRKNPPPRSAASGKKGGAGGSAGGGLKGQAKGGASTSTVRGPQVSRPLMSISQGLGVSSRKPLTLS